MKKLILILLTLSLITACENEALDPDLTGQDDGQDGGDDGGDGSESTDLTLSLYELDTDISFSFFGIPIRTVTNSNINVNNDKVSNSTVGVSVENSPFETENQSYSRNGSGQITSNISVNSEGVTTNEYNITYTSENINQITYDYFEDDEDDYTYNFTYDGNTITRTEVGSSISTVFTLDDSNRVVKKESFDGTFSIQTEILTYTANGNINGSITTGEIQSNTTYQFDDSSSPLKVVYEDNYLLQFLADDYSDEIGPLVAQFLSTNNWNAATFNGESFSFDLEYNTVGRIMSRDIAYDFGPDLMFEINERFNYVN
ncbi:hypothetical protein [Winogradskyella sp. PG-2]|uniref:hypothetical protein n=1 Tax=Winogradskyella sp. PG-2 TaxID=754409 RepID=UPI0004589714|nr:hypothetical protein [Winogradskyella sp. PG-2]BAO76332.1 hypothetical protein WPG_2102 [Winogradskyella sp. PG-2]